MPQEGASWRDRNMYFSKLRNHCHSTSFKSLVFASLAPSLSYLVSPPSWHHFLFCVHVESASFRKHYEVCALFGWEGGRRLKFRQCFVSTIPVGRCEQGYCVLMCELRNSVFRILRSVPVFGMTTPLHAYPVVIGWHVECARVDVCFIFAWQQQFVVLHPLWTT